MKRLLSNNAQDKCSCLNSGICGFLGALLLVLMIFGTKAYQNRVVFDLQPGDIIIQGDMFGIHSHKYIMCERCVIRADDKKVQYSYSEINNYYDSIYYAQEISVEKGSIHTIGQKELVNIFVDAKKLQ